MGSRYRFEEFTPKPQFGATLAARFQVVVPIRFFNTAHRSICQVQGGFRIKMHSFQLRVLRRGKVE